jgi:hypothetical protein
VLVYRDSKGLWAEEEKRIERDLKSTNIPEQVDSKERKFY